MGREEPLWPTQFPGCRLPPALIGGRWWETRPPLAFPVSLGTPRPPAPGRLWRGMRVSYRHVALPCASASLRPHHVHLPSSAAPPPRASAWLRPRVPLHPALTHPAEHRKACSSTACSTARQRWTAELNTSEQHLLTRSGTFPEHLHQRHTSGTHGADASQSWKRAGRLRSACFGPQDPVTINFHSLCFC